MLQGFYWNCAVKERKKGEWWNYEIPKLGKKGAGFASIWLPHFSKAANPDSNGYDSYDYFDLGDLDQKGSIKTIYGNGNELRRLIGTIHDKGMGAIADMVINNNSGTDEEEVNPLDGKSRWTKFNPRAASSLATGIPSTPAVTNGHDRGRGWVSMCFLVGLLQL